MQNPAQSTNASPAHRRPTDSSTRDDGAKSHRRALDLPGSAFSASFLEKLRLLARLQTEDDATHSTAAEAALSGPLAVETVEAVEAKTGGIRYAVVRKDEPVAAGGKAAALFRDRDEALRAAAVLPAVAAPSPYRLKDKPKRLGYPLHHHRRHVGHVGRLAEARREALLGHLHLARYLTANPYALALLLEAAGL